MEEPRHIGYSKTIFTDLYYEPMSSFLVVIEKMYYIIFNEDDNSNIK